MKTATSQAKRHATDSLNIFASPIPNACFVGFTGTPIKQSDKNTSAIFGNYIDIYDISQAVADGATVPIYYESRLVKVDLDETGRQLLDELDEDNRSTKGKR